MMKDAPKLSHCSPAALLTSVAETTAPSLFAVAMACRPATPTPIIKILAGAIVPAAVIIIGIALLYREALFITALYPAKLDCEDNTSIDCALGDLGINSIEKALIPFFDKSSNFSLLS